MTFHQSTCWAKGLVLAELPSSLLNQNTQQSNLLPPRLAQEEHVSSTPSFPTLLIGERGGASYFEIFISLFIYSINCSKFNRDFFLWFVFSCILTLSGITFLPQNDPERILILFHQVSLLFKNLTSKILELVEMISEDAIIFQASQMFFKCLFLFFLSYTYLCSGLLLGMGKVSSRDHM